MYLNKGTLNRTGRLVFDIKLQKLKLHEEECSFLLASAGLHVLQQHRKRQLLSLEWV